jgi:hypothetical protein
MGVETCVIPVEHFLNVRKVLGGSSGSLHELALQMKRTYKCFNDEGHDKRYSARPTLQREHVKHSESRTRIGNKILSKEAISKKEFLLHANKLTPKNKDAIIKSFKPHIRRECGDIYIHEAWDLIQRAPEYQEVYVGFVATIFEDHRVLSEKIAGIYSSYMDKKAWYPVTTSDDYDEFCDFVKWKKRAIAAVQGFKMFCKSGFLDESCLIDLSEELATTIDEQLATCNGSPAVDALLEQIGHLPIKNDTIVERWRANLSTYRPSTKFKILDILNGLQAADH